MHSERGLLINGTRRRHGKSRPASKNGGAFYELIVGGLSDDARAPAAGDFGPMATITPLVTD